MVENIETGVVITVTENATLEDDEIETAEMTGEIFETAEMKEETSEMTDGSSERTKETEIETTETKEKNVTSELRKTKVSTVQGDAAGPRYLDVSVAGVRIAVTIRQAETVDRRDRIHLVMRSQIFSWKENPSPKKISPTRMRKKSR